RAAHSVHVLRSREGRVVLQHTATHTHTHTHTHSQTATQQQAPPPLTSEKDGVATPSLFEKNVVTPPFKKVCKCLQPHTSPHLTSVPHTSPPHTHTHSSPSI